MDICKAVLSQFEVEQLECSDVFYQCNCSRQRVENALISIGREGLADMAAQQEPTQVECHFCDHKYLFTPDEISRLMEKAQG